MTKPITSVAVLTLFELGKLRLSDPVSHFFPQFRSMQVYQSGSAPPFQTIEAEREITIWDLLTHTSGLAYGIGNEHPAEQAFADAVWNPLVKDPDLDLEYFAEVVAEQPLLSQPGTEWRYSASADLLAAIVERIAGRGFEEYLRDTITGPLGMSDTHFTVPHSDRARFATMYGMQEDGTIAPVPDPKIMGFVRPTSHPNGGGGLVSTAHDYLQFAHMLSAGGELDGTRILGARTVELMTSNHLPGGFAVNGRQGVGFGLGVEVLRDVTSRPTYGSVGQYGWGGAATTRFWIDPRENLVVLVLLQLLPGFCRPIVDDVYAATYQAIAE
jgi:CubicO group peptidase (beta-lactamase class C family)